MGTSWMSQFISGVNWLMHISLHDQDTCLWHNEKVSWLEIEVSPLKPCDLKNQRHLAVSQHAVLIFMHWDPSLLTSWQPNRSDPQGAWSGFTVPSSGRFKKNYLVSAKCTGWAKHCLWKVWNIHCSINPNLPEQSSWMALATEVRQVISAILSSCQDTQICNVS